MSEQTYKALSISAERIGMNAYRQQLAEHKKRGRKPSTFRFNPPQIQRDIVTAMGDRTITDEEAMGLIWHYDAMQLRFPPRGK